MSDVPVTQSPSYLFGAKITLQFLCIGSRVCEEWRCRMVIGYSVTLFSETLRINYNVKLMGNRSAKLGSFICISILLAEFFNYCHAFHWDHSSFVPCYYSGTLHCTVLVLISVYSCFPQFFSHILYQYNVLSDKISQCLSGFI